MFSPQTIPAEVPRLRITDATRGEPLPWEPGSYLEKVELRPGREWRHVIYGGLFEVARVHEALVAVFGEDPDAAAEHPARGQSAVFSCTVDARGLLVEGSAVLASCAWAVGEAAKTAVAGALTGLAAPVSALAADMVGGVATNLLTAAVSHRGAHGGD